jgi:hypothetical protein
MAETAAANAAALDFHLQSTHGAATVQAVSVARFDRRHQPLPFRRPGGAALSLFAVAGVIIQR